MTKLEPSNQFELGRSGMRKKKREWTIDGILNIESFLYKKLCCVYMKPGRFPSQPAKAKSRLKQTGSWQWRTKPPRKCFTTG